MKKSKKTFMLFNDSFKIAIQGSIVAKTKTHFQVLHRTKLMFVPKEEIYKLLN